MPATLARTPLHADDSVPVEILRLFRSDNEPDIGSFPNKATALHMGLLQGYLGSKYKGESSVANASAAYQDEVAHPNPFADYLNECADPQSSNAALTLLQMRYAVAALQIRFQCVYEEIGNLVSLLAKARRYRALEQIAPIVSEEFSGIGEKAHTLTALESFKELCLAIDCPYLDNTAICMAFEIRNMRERPHRMEFSSGKYDFDTFKTHVKNKSLDIPGMGHALASSNFERAVSFLDDLGPPPIMFEHPKLYRASQKWFEERPALHLAIELLSTAQREASASNSFLAAAGRVAKGYEGYAAPGNRSVLKLHWDIHDDVKVGRKLGHTGSAEEAHGDIANDLALGYLREMDFSPEDQAIVLHECRRRAKYWNQYWSTNAAYCRHLRDKQNDNYVIPLKAAPRRKLGLGWRRSGQQTAARPGR